MIFGNIKKTSRFIFYSLFFVFFSCNESDSIILNPPSSNTFQVKSFILDSAISTSKRSSDFNAGDSPRSYIGFVDENTESNLLIKIDKDLIINNDVCDEDTPVFNDLNFNLFLKTNLTEILYHSDTYTIEENNILNDSGYNSNEDCGDTGPIYNWVYVDNLDQPSCEVLNPQGWIGETDYCGYLGQTNQCCKYEDCIACCNTSSDTDSYNVSNIINAYILDSSEAVLQNYEEDSNYNHDTSWMDDAIEENLNVTVNNSFKLTIDLYDYLTSQGDQNLCTLSSDLFVLLKLNPDFSNLYEETFIEFFSSEDTSPSYYYYKPYVVINYDELTDVSQEHIKYSIDNDNINFNANLTSSNISYNINNTDSINILAFSNSQDYPLEADCYCYQIDEANDCNTCSACSWSNENCFYNIEINQPQLSPIINAGYSEELFNFNITIDDTYLNLIELKDTLDDIIKFRLKENTFIFNDQDPLNDDWNDYGSDGCDDVMEDGEGGCLSLQEETIYDINENPDPNSDNYDITTNPDGTQSNLVYDEGEGIEENFHFDEGEEFDDFGIDFCPDEYEDGVGCLCNVNIDGECESLDENLIVFRLGYENNGMYDEDEYWKDAGIDGCFSMYEDGNGYCLCDINVEGDCDGVELIYNICEDADVVDGICDGSNPVEYYNPDPNGDDFSLDPSGDNWHDYGIDGCPDELEDGNQGCLEVELTEEQLAVEPDPNGDNYDEDNNDQGTEENNSYELGEGLEDNLQYDLGEYWIDAGVDQLFDIHEPGYDIVLNPDPHGDNYHEDNNPEGTELSYEYEEGEWYFDDGIDQLDNHNEYDIGYDENGKENNNQYDSGEDWKDAGSDGCFSMYEDGNGYCLCDINVEGDCDGVELIYNICEDADVVDGICDGSNPVEYYNPDPNKDDLNEDPNGDNLNDFENNQIWDYEDDGIDACPDELEDGNQGCLEVELTEEQLAVEPDPNGDNYDEDNNPNGTEGNSIFDYNFSITGNTFWEFGNGEKFERFYDNGDGDISQNEEYYYGNDAPASVTPLFYINSINDLEIDESFEGQKTNDPDKNIFLWINSITKTAENKYKVSVHLETFIDITAFEIHLYHDHFEYSEEIMEEKLTGLWPYEDNLNNDGEKYILDASVYQFDETICTINNNDCISSDLLLSYGHGMKSNLAFKDNEGQYFYEFMEDLKSSNQFTVFSDEYTKLLLYFDLTEGSLHNVDEYTEIKIEYFDEEEMKYEIFPLYYQSVTINEEYIAIPIVYFMQSYLVGDLNIFNNPFEILLSASSNKFNFSKIAIDANESRIEVFYSE